MKKLTYTALFMLTFLSFALTNKIKFKPGIDENCSDTKMNGSHLEYNCEGNSGSLDLNECITNNRGIMKWKRNGNFVETRIQIKSCKNCIYQWGRLNCKCHYGQNNHNNKEFEISEIKLNEHVKVAVNENNLKYLYCDL